MPCYIDLIYPKVGIATLELLERFGLNVEYRELSVSLRSHDWEVKTQMGRGGYSAPACR